MAKASLPQNVWTLSFTCTKLVFMDESRTLTVDALAGEIREFGKAGGFRERAASVVLDGCLRLRSVELRERLDSVDVVEAFRRITDETIQAELEPGRGAAMTVFVQVREKSGAGRDVTDRRKRAGAQMTSPSRPRGISGRTWERKYELPACEELARGLLRAEAELARSEAAVERPRLAKSWPLRLAVLPFRYAAEGSLDEVLIDGFADDIISRLSRVQGLEFVSPTSARAWMVEPDPLQAAHDRAGVDLVVTGAIRRDGAVLHMTLRLDETSSRTTRWSDSFDLEASDLLGAQLAVAEAVLQVLQPRETGAVVQASGGDTGDASAYELYLRGTGHVLRNTAVELSLAVELYERALAIDDAFANAHAQLGYALWRQYFSGWAGNEALNESLRRVNRAVQLDQTSISARFTRIRILWDLGLHEDALREGKRAVIGHPQARQARLALARALNNAGLADLALPLTETILNDEPREVAARKLLIWNLLMVGDYERASVEGRSYLTLNPGDANTSWAVAAAYFMLDQHGEAVRVASQGLISDTADATLWLLKGYVLADADSTESALRTWNEGIALVEAQAHMTGPNDRLESWLANLHACVGSESQAMAIIEQVEERQPKNSYLAYRSCMAYAQLRQIDAALTRLRGAIDHGFLSVQLLRLEEAWGLTSITSTALYEPRVQELERKVAAIRENYAPLVEELVSATNETGGGHGKPQ